MSISIVGSFEKASQGYMDQQHEAALFEYALGVGRVEDAGDEAVVVPLRR